MSFSVVQIWFLFYFFFFVDQDTELKLAHLKIKDLENALRKQKDEVECLSFYSC